MKIIFLSLFIAHFYSCSNHETETKAWIMSDKYKIYLDEPVDSVKWEIDNLQTAKISEMGVTYLSVMEPTVIWKGVSANPSIITAFDSSKRLKTFEIIYTLNTIDKKMNIMDFVREKIDNSVLDCSAFLASGKGELSLVKDKVKHEWRIVTNSDFPKFSYKVYK